MLIVIFCIGLALIVTAAILYNIFDTDIVHIPFACFGSFIILVALVAGILLVGSLKNLQIIDNRITLCEEVNAEKEAVMKATVEQYMKYEGETLKDLQVESIMAALSIYPELKADAMVQDLINTYNKNKDEIKSLKVKKLNEPIYRWWLYFGN